MKKLLFAPFDLLSHYLRCLSIANYLDKNQYEIVFLRSQRYQSFVEANGYKITNATVNAYENVVSKASKFNFSWINKQSVRQTVNSFIQVIEDEKPDILFSDTFLGAKIVAEKLNLNHVALLNAYVTNYYAGLRDVPHHHKAIRFKKYVSPEKWERIVRSIEEMTLKQVHSPFRKLRLEWHLPPQNNLFDEFAGQYNLLCDDENIFPLRTKPDNYTYIGPVLYNCLKHSGNIKSFIERNKHLPLLYITSGSSGKYIVPDILKIDELNQYAIIVAGYYEDVEYKNMMFRKFVNFDDIAPDVDLVICHGGNGSVYQALNAGKRIIAVPWIFEQEWNVQRFSQLGLCQVFYPDEKPIKLKNLISKLLEQEPHNLFLGKYLNIQLSNDFFEQLK
ncbi:MAG: hypothetical protein HPY79_05295 [Bacteroidales bacterium]|nr:hypothetical protein [Bacteroidales bacterium]